MHDCFVSVVAVLEDDAELLVERVRALSEMMRGAVSEYELVLVDNASRDDTVERLERLSAELPNLQTYCLSLRAERDVALVAGLEQAIGDYVVTLDLRLDDSKVVLALLEKGVEGNDLAFARPARAVQTPSRFYNLFSAAYVRLYRWVTGLDLRLDSPRTRLMSRRIVNYVLQHESAYLIYQTLPVSAGFKRAMVELPMAAESREAPRLRSAVNRGIALLLSTSPTPMRLVSATCLAGAFACVIYSVYVVAIYAFKREVAPGWTTLSLEMSGMFFLLSIALAILSEQMLWLTRLATRRPPYHLAREFRSSSLTREQRLNLRPGSAAETGAPAVPRETPWTAGPRPPSTS